MATTLSAKDPALEQLEILLKETLSVTSDPKIKEKLVKAQEVVSTAQ